MGYVIEKLFVGNMMPRSATLIYKTNPESTVPDSLALTESRRPNLVQERQAKQMALSRIVQHISLLLANMLLRTTGILSYFAYVESR